MDRIVPPIRPRERGPVVANLQAVLLFIVEKRGLSSETRPLIEWQKELSSEIATQLFGEQTSRLLTALLKLLDLSAAEFVDGRVAEGLNRQLEELGAFTRPDTPPPADSENSFHVMGRVTSRARGGVGHIRVQIVGKKIGAPEVGLAETTTDDAGGYEIAFLIADRKERPDLQARVYGGEQVLGVSEVRYNATNRETLDVLITDTASSALPSEYETLVAALSNHFKGNLRDLKEDDNQQDITHLANKTGWDARAVAFAALADQFSARTKGGEGESRIEPAYFYALFRAGLRADERTLFHADAGTLAAVWNKAVAQGVIPKAYADGIPKAIERFQVLGARGLLSEPGLVGASSMKEMLSASQLDDSQQQRFAELYTAHRTDMAAFWVAAGTAFGAQTASRLQVDGKLAFLTINNAPLISVLRAAAMKDELTDPLQLARAGFHRATRWETLLTKDVPIPKETPGDTPEAKRVNYAQYLAAQVRVSYPTAAVAEMLGSGDLKLTGAERGVSDKVLAFLTKHEDKFEIGAQPIEQYLRQHPDEIEPKAVTQIKRLQRVYQITPGDAPMAGLLKLGIDSAYKVVQHDKEAFVRTFAKDLGGADSAAIVHDRSMQVHNAVFNIAVSYLTARNGIALGAQPLQATAPGSGTVAQVLQPAPKRSGSAFNASALSPQPAARSAAKRGAALSTPEVTAQDVIALPTLESLFGEMDFCACDHCRSVLSPAAYLVDLLLFLDQPIAAINPQQVLFDRRPDIQHLPLTCENTNTALPYIDVVNETLEYFIANSVQALTLDEYAGHDTGDMASADLLASPQFVIDLAYNKLRTEYFPAPLPFDQPLESLRRHFEKFGVPLPLAMERLCPSGTNPPYDWVDILMEEVRLSPAEYEILTGSNAVSLLEMYGFPGTEPDVIAALSNAKKFTRRMGITYEDIVAILRTRFINPNGDLIPKLQRLGVSVTMLAKLKTQNDATTDAEFDALLPAGALALDAAEYGGNIKAWVKDPVNYARIMGLITLFDPSPDPDPCNFDKLEFRHADTTVLSDVEFVRLLRFVRLWKKLRWTIEQTDAAICALYRADLAPLAASDIDTVVKLNTGFLTLLPRLGVIVRIMRALSLSPKRDLLPLLACFSDIGTYGDGALYRQMFLNPAILEQDAVYADNGYGEFLTANSVHLADHAESLRSAFNLVGDEYDRIVESLGYDGNTPLTIPNISAIFRRGYLARKLKLSVREFLLLTSLTGLDPFVAPDITNPAISQIISLVQALKDRSLKSAVALYLIWNQDLSGKSAQDPAQVTEFARTLRGDFASIEDQFAASEDAEGDVARARMTLVYGQETADAFFALLDDTIVLDVAHTHSTSTLEPAIIAADAKIAYDGFRHRLSHTGVLTTATQGALKAVAGVTAVFQTAVDVLFARSEDAKGSFFNHYPELKILYDTYIASLDPPAMKRAALLAAFRPELSRRRKRQQALQRLSAAATIDLASTQILFDASAAPYPLHAAGYSDQPALNDVLALETAGLAAQFFFRDTATGVIDLSVPVAANIDNASGANNSLPANPTSGAAISGIWRGQLETPEAGFYNFVVEADSAATVTLMLGGQACPLTQNGNVRRNTDPIELKAGTLYEVVLTVEKVKTTLSVQWETPKRAREVIPGRYLYPPTILAPFSDAYIRFLKVASLTGSLGLTANEMAHFATHADYQIAGDGWLNVLPVSGTPAAPTAVALLKPLLDLLDYARIKAAISPGDERLLTVLKDPVVATANTDSLLFTLTGWPAPSLDAVLAQFGGTKAGLTHLEMFRRVYDAFALIRTMGISASTLIQATTNEPTGGTVRDLQAALRARYAAADWRDVVKPINDQMRSLQRDALVAYILHQMRSNPATEHIDTADKLFEYFLMDVQMEPCMLTSRIRHALSSVQLFIERCFMNLEPRVSSASLNAKQWEWMKRYRVWEANRKVFLFPENWLEPELRDDKSPFFKEIESELLQSDITEETAAAALLNYLSKLEEVAKLEPCGIHHVEADSARTGDIEHVIARSAGGHRKYFYRRKEFGYWTPWEQIKLDIEDNPVVPVVWNDRLLLFWLRIMKQGDLTPTPSSSQATQTVGELATDAKDINNRPKMVVQAVLCWSEYYNGKWQPARTSEVDRPAELGKFASAGPLAFKRSDLQLFFLEEGDALRVNISGSGHATFLLYNTHSLPMHDVPTAVGGTLTAATSLSIFTFGKWRGFTCDVDNFTVTYGTGMISLLGSDLTRNVLKPKIPFKLIEPRHRLNNIWDAPFFFEDWRHVFFVTTSELAVRIQENLNYGFTLNPFVLQEVTIQPLFPVANAKAAASPIAR